MRLYAGRFLRSSMAQQVERRVESRDAILVSVDARLRIAVVKVQGSSAQIIAHFPENMASAETWLKVGNAVRISHTGGQRGRVELVGHGATLPTLLPGDTLVTPGTSADAIMSGLQVIALGGMVVGVRTGTVRWSGAVSTVDLMTMSATSPLVLGADAYLGTMAGAFTVPTAPAAGTYRYDLIVVGSDNVLDYITGIAATTPSKPTVPSVHLECGSILVAPGMTSITQPSINATFIPAAAAHLDMAIADNDLAWGETSTTVTVTVKDQYGNTITTVGAGWNIALEIMSGNGAVSVGGTSSTTSVSGFTTGSSLTFTYTRDGLDPGDQSPTLRATVADKGLAAYGHIFLRDVSGNMM